MTWTTLDTWIAIVAALGAASCALLGNFLVLRRMSMMGDAISHAVLPGLAVGFLLTGSRHSFAMFVGAAIVGVLTAVFTEWIRKFGRVERSAAMGVVFTTLFALGLVLIVRTADRVDLDPGCVLYGAIELTPLDTISLLGFEIPRAALVLSIVLLLDIAFVIVFFKELQISSFDPELATTLGIRSSVMHYALMTLVAITTVASFESVGSILVIAMLIVPPAAAHLLTDRLRSMLFVSLGLAVISALLGHLSAIHVPGWFGYRDTSTAGMMGVVAGALFVAALLFAPQHGVTSRAARRFLLALRITREDVLGLLYRLEELRSAPPRRTTALVHDALGTGRTLLATAIRTLRHQGHIVRDGDDYRLTDRGRSRARDLIRSHRLWESYLHKHLAMPVDRLHRGAEALEHVTGARMRDRLEESTDRPAIDPQGKPIPPSDELPSNR